MTDRELYRFIIDKLGKSRPTASTWINESSYPAEACIEIEHLTNGEVTAQSLRPDLFKPNRSQIKLGEVVKRLHDTEDTTIYLLTGVLSYFKEQQPDMYSELIESLNETEFGEEYLKQRTLYTNEKL